MAKNEDKSKSVFAGRMGVGYGYDLPYTIGYTSKESGVSRQFNLTGMLTYSTSQKISTASKLKNNIGLLFQPGYYLPLKSTPVLIYGTVGYAWASFDQQTEMVSADGRLIAPGDTTLVAIFNGPVVGGGSFSTKGLILGLGAKYAITGRLYAGFDYTHTEYDYKESKQVLGWRDGNARLLNHPDTTPTAVTFNTDWQAKKLRTDTFLLTVGYRFF